MDADPLNMHSLLIALKRRAEEPTELLPSKKTASSLLLYQVANHPLARDYDTPVRLLFETLHRNAMRQEEPINVQLYARIKQLVYRIPPVIALERTRFAEVVRLDLIGLASRQLESDEVLFYTYDFSYLAIFPSLEMIHVSHCHVCLGSHLLEGVPNLSSLYMIACEVFWVAPDFQRAVDAGKVTLIDMVDRTAK